MSEPKEKLDELAEALLGKMLDALEAEGFFVDRASNLADRLLSEIRSNINIILRN